MSFATPPTAFAAPEAPPDEGTSTLTDAVLRPVLVLASLGTAAIHFAFAPMHLEANQSHGLFFVAIAWLAVGWAFAVSRQPTPLTFRLGALLNLGILGVWLTSRTAGIGGEVEPFGWPDSIAAGLEGLIVVGSFGPLVNRLPRTRVPDLTRGLALGACAVGIAVAVSASMLPSLSGHAAGSGHSHDGAAGETAAGADGHPHDGAAGETAAGADDHPHDETPATAAAVAVPFDPAKPIDLSGTPGVTPEQQAEAEAIVIDTIEGLPQWADQDVAFAAGFRSIGDAGTGNEHLINQAWMDDDTIFDPNKPESLVYDVKDGKKTLAAAMYMLKTGTPLEEAPTTGGALMQWHIHNNLCYNAKGKVAGLTQPDGTCRPPLVLPPETPMIHVWIRPHECGPFAALEGVGAGAIAEGETRLCDHAHGS